MLLIDMHFVCRMHDANYMISLDAGLGLYRDVVLRFWCSYRRWLIDASNWTFVCMKVNACLCRCTPAGYGRATSAINVLL